MQCRKDQHRKQEEPVTRPRHTSKNMGSYQGDKETTKMKKLTVVGRNEDQELQEYHVLNPTNVIVSKGVTTRPGELVDPATQEPIPVKEEVTVLRIGGIPLLSVEKVDEVLKRVEEL
jgi:hypothetical protein